MPTYCLYETILTLHNIIGILILTSNRVGTFDEAFKSRILISLHYPPLTTEQRRQIWRNFFNRLRTLTFNDTIDDVNAANRITDVTSTELPTSSVSAVDFDDLFNHVEVLAKEPLNGREIRNAITTARQLALYKKKPFSYAHVRHVINVVGKFQQYVKNLREGYSADEIARSEGIR